MLISQNAPCVASNSYSEVPATQKTCKIKKECLVATTEDNFRIMNQVCNKKDEAALQRMIAAKQVYILNPQYSVSMMEHGFAKCKIYVSSLSSNVWVSTENIEYK